MAIDVECGACFHTFRVAAQHAGKRGKCPECGDPVRIPGGSPSGGAAPRPSGTAPRASGSSGKRSSEGRGRQKTKKKAGRQTGLIVGISSAVGILLGLVMLQMFRGPAEEAPAAVADNKTDTPAANPSQTDSSLSATEAAPRNPVAAAPSAEPATTNNPSVDPPGQAAMASVAKPSESTTAEAAVAVATTTLAPVGEPMTAVQLVKRTEPSIVRINALSEENELEWHGSGFVIDASGVIATNHHVVAGAHKCVAEFASGKTFEVKGYYVMDEKRDIALLQVDLPAGEYQALPLVSTSPEKGEQVLAFGCPYGLDFSTTDGLISAFRSAADLKSMLGNDVSGEWLQTSAPVSPGNSGGPLVNMKGEVVGINSLVRREGQNLNFAISAADVRSMFDKRGETLTALSRGTESEDGKISVSGSRAAKRFLAKIDTVLLLILREGDEAKPELSDVVETFAKKHLRSANIGVTGIRTSTSPLMLITVEAQDGVDQGTADVAIVAQLLYPTVVDGHVRILMVWETRGEIGSPKKFKLRRDPKGELQAGLTKFFEGMANEIKAAKKSTDN